MMDYAELIAEFKLPDAEAFLLNCQKYHALLEEANKTVNLTRIDSYDGFMIKHILDSLYIVKYFPFLSRECVNLADVGCGAGFPAVVLAMAFPNLRVTAIDSIGKKVRFVEAVKQAVNLTNLTAVQGRSREMGYKAEWQSKFQVITARAVGNGAVIYAEAVRLLAPGGKFILYKTPHQALEELPLMGNIKPSRKWHLTETFSLPQESGERTFMYF